MSRADRATLRLAIGLGLAALVAYGAALPMPFVVCVMSVLVLCKQGPPLPLLKGLVVALVFAALVATGVVMVPLLEHYALTGLLLTGVILFGVAYAGIRSGNPLTLLLVIAFTLIPAAGIAEQALVTVLSVSLGVGVAIGVVVSAVSNALFPDREDAANNTAQRAAPALPGHEAAMLGALRSTFIVMPVFVLALINPAMFFATILKTVALSQQVGETGTRSAGRELVLSTLAGALLALMVWMGLSLWPSLWMLTLWLTAAGLWCGSALYGTRSSRYSPSFWSNALITMLILLGPAIEDSAVGKGVMEASVVRTALFVAVAFYAWGATWLFEQWRAARVRKAAVAS